MGTTYRLFGLDFYRVAAILMVLLANTIFFFQLELPAVSDLAPMIGFVGLEIFLVLSGFLLATAFYPIFMSETFGLGAWLQFIKIRLLRIVPLYFLIVVINIGIAAAMDYPFDHAWKYFFFLQNFSGSIPAFFPESWGLPVIVFGMLLFTSLLFGLSKVVRQKQKSFAFLMAAVVLMLIFIWTKWLYNSVQAPINMADWEMKLRTVVLYRIDSVMIGALFGWIFRNNVIFLQKMRWFFAILGCAGLAFLTLGVGYFHLIIEDYPAFWNIVYLPLTSIILACFLPMMSSWTKVPKGFNFIPFVSKATFSIYLTHFSIVLLLLEHFLKTDAASANTLISLAVSYFVVAIAFGCAVYFLIEKRMQNGLNR